MEVHCKVCGKKLRDPVSIARGIGPKCAGEPTGRNRFRQKNRKGEAGPFSPFCEPTTTQTLFVMSSVHQCQVPDHLRSYPNHLVDLVLAGAVRGSTPEWVGSPRKRKQPGLDPITLLKQLRRTCIELRLHFWPGLSRNLEPVPCIPHGQDSWKIGEDGRVISKDELLAYLCRYGLIAREHALTTMREAS